MPGNEHLDLAEDDVGLRILIERVQFENNVIVRLMGLVFQFRRFVVIHIDDDMAAYSDDAGQ